MPIPTTYDLSRIQRALGAKSSYAQPFFANEFLYPMLVVGDMSRSFGPEQFEARAYANMGGNAGPLEEPVTALTSVSPGGIVIERVDIASETSGVPDSSVRFDLDVPRSLLGEFAPFIFQVGGVPVTSLPVGGRQLTQGLVRALVQLDDFGQKTFENFQWFIPSGSTFYVIGDPDSLLSVSVQWREIPQAPGGP